MSPFGHSLTTHCGWEFPFPYSPLLRHVCEVAHVGDISRDSSPVYESSLNSIEQTFLWLACHLRYSTMNDVVPTGGNLVIVKWRGTFKWGDLGTDIAVYQSKMSCACGYLYRLSYFTPFASESISTPSIPLISNQSSAMLLSSESTHPIQFIQPLLQFASLPPSSGPHSLSYSTSVTPDLPDPT